MKTKLLPLILCLCLLGATPSCETYNLVSPATNVAASTYTVQTAEHTLRAAKDTLDLFFGLVKDHHDFVVTNLPQVYSFAQQMQTKAPDILRKADRAKNTFKYNRTSTSQTNLNTIMATVAALMIDTQANIKQIQAVSP